jgi:hypothetical protein
MALYNEFTKQGTHYYDLLQQENAELHSQILALRPLIEEYNKMVIIASTMKDEKDEKQFSNQIVTLYHSLVQYQQNALEVKQKCEDLINLLEGQAKTNNNPLYSALCDFMRSEIRILSNETPRNLLIFLKQNENSLSFNRDMLSDFIGWLIHLHPNKDEKMLENLNKQQIRFVNEELKKYSEIEEKEKEATKLIISKQELGRNLDIFYHNASFKSVEFKIQVLNQILNKGVLSTSTFKRYFRINPFHGQRIMLDSPEYERSKYACFSNIATNIDPRDIESNYITREICEYAKYFIETDYHELENNFPLFEKIANFSLSRFVGHVCIIVFVKGGLQKYVSINDLNQSAERFKPSNPDLLEKYNIKHTAKIGFPTPQTHDLIWPNEVLFYRSVKADKIIGVITNELEGTETFNMIKGMCIKYAKPLYNARFELLWPNKQFQN